MKRLFTLPNILTCFRIVGALLLLFLAMPSTAFYVIYTVSGITDMMDGFLARALHQESELGSKLDSVADLTFYTVMIVKIFPFLVKQLPIWLWCFIEVIVAVRLSSYLTAFYKYHRFASLHTYMNKLTGLLIFPVPYFLGGDHVVVYYTVICCVAALASIEELLIHIHEPKYVDKKQTIFKSVK